MKMESKRVACRAALNMASTGRLKNVDYEDKEYQERKANFAKLIRENVRPIHGRNVFDAAAVLAPLIESGVVATCGVIEFELGWATRSSAEFDQVRADRDAGYEWLATHDEDWRRALAVQAALWRGGRMRSVCALRESAGVWISRCRH